MQAVELFLKIGQTLSIVHYVPGRIRLRFSKDSIPLIKQFSELDCFNNLSMAQFIDTLSGINDVKVNQITGSATIQYNTSVWTKAMWESFCAGRNEPELTSNVTDAINKF